MRIKKNYFLALFASISFCGWSQLVVPMDAAKEQQTIVGFGGHDPRDRADFVVDDMGYSVERIWLDADFKPTEGAAYNFDKSMNEGASGRSTVQALINKGVKTFIATPWTPPGWMKYINGEGATDAQWNRLSNGLHPYANLEDGLLPGQLKVDLRNMYEDYANYLTEFAKQFKQQMGLDLYAISMGNEPRFAQSFPSCVYEPKQMRDLVRLVGPKLKAAGLKTQVFCAEDMAAAGTSLPWIDAILKDPKSVDYVSFWAVHGYTDGVSASTGSMEGWSNQYNQVAEYGKNLWMTETSGYLNWNDGTVTAEGTANGAFTLAKDIFYAVKYGRIAAWVWWRTAITESFWEDEGLIHYGTPHKTYYASKQFYKYIRPGAKQIESTSPSNDLLIATFMHGEESRFTMIGINKGSNTTFKLDASVLPPSLKLYRTTASENFADKGSVNPANAISIDGNTINTYVYEGTNKMPTINQIDKTTIIARKAGETGQHSIDLTGITSGGESGQTISITSSSDNAALFDNLSVTYTSPNNTGKLNITLKEGASGLAKITLLVNDNSTADNGFFSKKYMTFTLNVQKSVNAAPTINTISDVIIPLSGIKQTISLTGITDGNEGDQTVTMSILSSNTTILRTLKTVYTSGSTGSITFYPNVLGTTTITLTLKDNGGNELNGVDTKVITFKITISDKVNSVTESRELEAGIFPNPASGSAYIFNPDFKFKQIAITDISGKQVFVANLQTEKDYIDISNFQQGLYIVRFINDEKISISNFIVK